MGDEKKRERELEDFNREMDRLCKLQREGAFGPVLDIGGYTFPMMHWYLSLGRRAREIEILEAQAQASKSVN